MSVKEWEPCLSYSSVTWQPHSVTCFQLCCVLRLNTDSNLLIHWEIPIQVHWSSSVKFRSTRMWWLYQLWIVSYFTGYVCIGRYVRRDISTSTAVSELSADVYLQVFPVRVQLWPESTSRFQLVTDVHVFCVCDYERVFPGWALTGKTRKSRGIWRWWGKGRGNYEKAGVVCCCSHKIKLTQVLVSKVDMHKMDCQYGRSIHSGVHQASRFF